MKKKISQIKRSTTFPLRMQKTSLMIKAVFNTSVANAGMEEGSGKPLAASSM